MEEKDIKDIEREVFNYNVSNHDQIPKWINYNAVSRFKSVKRSIRRGHVDLLTGIIYPNRPYNNRKPTKGRAHNSLKRRIYEQLGL